MNKSVGVIGLGYVGLPLAIEVAKKGISVIGIDIDKSKIEALNSGKTSIEDINIGDLKTLTENGRLEVTSDYSKIVLCDILLVCVPTPLSNERVPDLKPMLAAIRSIAAYLKPKTLVIIESTVATGTTRNTVLPLLEELVNFPANEIEVAYSPERVDPSNKVWSLQNTPKIVSGITQSSKLRAIEFYSNFISEVIECESVEIAETAKLLENSFRFINISFINEFGIFCNALGIDINQVVKAAGTKPYGFMEFYPSIGVGGHCIPVDPIYLSDKARQVGSPIRMIELADQINRDLPSYFVSRAEKKLNGLEGKKILVVGVSYKPNISDVRETPVFNLISALRNKGAQVSWHDDLVKKFNGEESTQLSNNFDLAIIATAHDYLDWSKIGNLPIITSRSSL
ncbi:UDP-N-acetyl-D-glucosamine dehydrogenase [Candidatus Nanopelagicus hibericus]|uniref:UDP-N-acetyl-D-glucosamine dehydrogenase n=1 Tax=Candidatus Nanopelagicus hibericus TaxID=1884915 RepID=A0A249KAJ9_9ACTN|nr:nucleotide sugar dehydrogenase [Candidatus Nanopelagicus hibericus]ASY13792.1 UDP-N-acetyl-D-glucosamine dehydrogenase [Candidatus Nanopelagicus hibericus]